MRWLQQAWHLCVLHNPAAAPLVGLGDQCQAAACSPPAGQQPHILIAPEQPAHTGHVQITPREYLESALRALAGSGPSVESKNQVHVPCSPPPGCCRAALAALCVWVSAQLGPLT